MIRVLGKSKKRKLGHNIKWKPPDKETERRRRERATEEESTNPCVQLHCAERVNNEIITMMYGSNHR